MCYGIGKANTRCQGKRKGPGKGEGNWALCPHKPCLAPTEASSPPLTHQRLSPIAVVVVLVVAAQGRQAALADGKGEEDLGARIHPHLREAQESGRGSQGLELWLTECSSSLEPSPPPSVPHRSCLQPPLHIHLLTGRTRFQFGPVCTQEASNACGVFMPRRHLQAQAVPGPDKVNCLLHPLSQCVYVAPYEL